MKYCAIIDKYSMEKLFKGEINYKTHSVVVESVEDKIYCFKHNDSRCEIKIFTDYEEMIEWTLEPFSSITWGLILDNDK